MSQFRKMVEQSSIRKLPSASQQSKSKTRYENVSPKTNSGYHVGKMMEDFDIIQRNFRFKPDEIFPRIKLSLLVSLICESIYLEAESHLAKNEATGDAAATTTAKTTLSSYSTHLDNEQEKKGNTDIPYLLLDVRDLDEYNKGHIITAENYPKSLLSRANFEIPSLLKYKNHPEHVIVVYDEDEILAPQVATTLMERGYDNVFMLSGGLKVAKHCFPHSLVVIPEVTMTVEKSQILETQLQQMSFRYRK
ncbi:centrosomal protein of 41 kDa-like [Daphnia carinata]|uniref:centrosomal protein of 41 kDa-like n=1 Tax=Daphnia carinata TaxID=120202 RepID=UPI00257FBD9D|nr:centrosomal protein of 41 kDa-like [Daphnia carinata]